MLFYFGTIILTHLGIILTLGGIIWQQVNGMLERRMERHQMRSSSVTVSALRCNISWQQSAATTIPQPDLKLNTVETVEEEPKKIWQTPVLTSLSRGRYDDERRADHS